LRIGIVGAGHVGLVSAACFARVGHEVVAVDAVLERIEDLRRGVLPFFEPGLEALVQEGLAAGRLCFSAAIADAVAEAEAVFICVGTPPRANGEADLSQVEHVAHQLAQHLSGRYTVLVEKSTV
jgi:UDPglucose 6-dehydrogenase